MGDKVWGQGSVKNTELWGKARFVSSLILPNAYGWGGIYEKTWTGDTNIIGVGEELQAENVSYYVYVLEQEGGNYLRGRIAGEMWIGGLNHIFLWQGVNWQTIPSNFKSFYGTDSNSYLSVSTHYGSWWGFGLYTYGSISYGPSNNFKLHMAFRVNPDLQNNPMYQHAIITVGVGGINGSGAEVTIASNQSYGFTPDFRIEYGTYDWQVIEIPVELLVSRGMNRYGYISNQNYLTFVGNGQFTFEADAIFWYLPTT